MSTAILVILLCSFLEFPILGLMKDTLVHNYDIIVVLQQKFPIKRKNPSKIAVSCPCSLFPGKLENIYVLLKELM